MSFFRKISSLFVNAIGWFILIAILILGLAAGLLLAGWIIIYVLGVLLGIVLIISFLYLILKLIGFK